PSSAARSRICFSMSASVVEPYTSGCRFPRRLRLGPLRTRTCTALLPGAGDGVVGGLELVRRRSLEAGGLADAGESDETDVAVPVLLVAGHRGVEVPEVAGRVGGRQADGLQDPLVAGDQVGVDEPPRVGEPGDEHHADGD